MSHFIFMKKYVQEPLITLTIELESGKFDKINIYEDSNPEELANGFVTDHYLSQAYIEPLKQNIIQQMLMYDQMKNTTQDTVKKRVVTNKENLQGTPNRNRSKSPVVVERKPTIKHGSTVKQPPQPMKRQQQQPQLTSPLPTRSPSNRTLNLKSPRLNQLCQNKSYDFLPKAEVKISILENEESVTQLPKLQTQESPNVSFSEESQFQNDAYTSEQVENSLSNLLKESDEKIASKLYSMVQCNKVVDARNIPYERFNCQLIVQLRTHFQRMGFKIMNQRDFCTSVMKNHSLMKSASEFFQL